MRYRVPVAAILFLAGIEPALAVDCPAVNTPVCTAGSDGTRSDFSNACLAEQKGYRVLHPGRCEMPTSDTIACPHLYNPVCATDPATGNQRSYPNTCAAEVGNATTLHQGACVTLRPGR